jgi:hypothetical protein
VWAVYERIIKYLEIASLKKVKLDNHNHFTLSPDMYDDRFDELFSSYLSISLDAKNRIVLTTVIDGEPLAWISYSSSQLDRLINTLERFRSEMG